MGQYWCTCKDGARLLRIAGYAGMRKAAADYDRWLTSVRWPTWKRQADAVAAGGPSADPYSKWIPETSAQPVVRPDINGFNYGSAANMPPPMPAYKQVPTGRWVKQPAVGLSGEQRDDTYTTDFAHPSSKYRIFIGGAGSNPKYYPVAGFSPDTTATFRYVDVQQARKYIQDLREKGVTQFQIVGHSRGGDVADLLASELEAQGIAPDTVLIDPVSVNPLYRNKPLRSKHQTIFMPKDNGWLDWSNLVARAGGRMRLPEGAEVLQYDGDHHIGRKGMSAVLERLNSWVAQKAPTGSGQADDGQRQVSYTKALRGH